jgi:hypothetical protein
MAIIKAGTLLMIEYGAYSDKGWYGPLRILRDFDQAEIAAKAKAARLPTPNGERSLYCEDLGAFLVSEGLAEHVDCASWDSGGYSLEPEIWPTDEATPQKAQPHG